MNAITCASKPVSRRDFLKTTTLTASGLVLAGVGLIASPGLSLAEEVDTSALPFAGMTLAELAQYFVKLGAVSAVNYDGGGSSEMVINGKIVNKPSDGRERLVSIGLGLFIK